MTNEAHLNVSQICAATVLTHTHTPKHFGACAHALQINTFLHLISPKHEGTYTHHEPGLALAVWEKVFRLTAGRRGQTGGLTVSLVITECGLCNERLPELTHRGKWMDFVFSCLSLCTCSCSRSLRKPARIAVRLVAMRGQCCSVTHQADKLYDWRWRCF